MLIHSRPSVHLNALGLSLALSTLRTAATLTGALLTAATLIASTPALAAGGGGGGSIGGGAGAQTRQISPEQKARKAHKAGEKDLEKAAEYRAKAAKEDSEKKRAKLLKKSDDRFKGALKDFERAIGYKADQYQSHSQRGFALRSLGRYEEALGAYDRALEIQPRYAQAIEYRAEAYLALGRLKDTKEAYVALFKGTPPLAEQLLTKMKQWIREQRAGEGAAVPSEELEAFARWVEKRDGIAQQTSAADVGEGSQRW